MRKEEKSDLRKKFHVFLVDDHPITREGLARVINQEPDMEVCGQAGTTAKAVTMIASLRPDLAIVDVSLGVGANGIELIKDIAARNPEVRTLALSTHDEVIYAERALRAGAKGYVMKQEATEKVMAAIRQVLHGSIYLSERMSNRLLGKLVHHDSPPTVSEIERLSDRELEIFQLIGQGCSTREIAGDLHLSISTVATHRLHIKEKLHFQNASELVHRAVEWVHSQVS